VSLGGASIEDASANDAVFSGANSKAASPAIVVDTTAPTVNAGTESSQSLSGNDIDAGKVVTFAIDMSEPVTVTTGVNGPLSLALNNGETATYTGPAGPGSTLTFSYTVQSGDDIGDLQATGFNALPTGTTVQDGAGNNADFTGFVAIDTGVKVDTTSPGFGPHLVGSPGGNVVEPGQTVTFTVNMSEQVVVTNGGNGLPTLTLNDNEVATYTGTAGSPTSALTFSYTVQPGDMVLDLQGIAIDLPAGTTIQDLAHNNVNLATFTPIDTGKQVVDPNLTAPDLTTLDHDIQEISVGGLDAAPGVLYKITLTGDIDLTSGGSVVNVDGFGLLGSGSTLSLDSGSTLTLDGSGHAVTGGDAHHGFFITSGGITVENLDVESGLISVAGGGVVSNTTFSGTGAEYVQAGGTDLGATLGSGGKQFVEVGAAHRASSPMAARRWTTAPRPAPPSRAAATSMWRPARARTARS
jgi:hypothetical protein